VLEAITPEKIEEASLRDLVSSYKILKDKELVTDGKPSEIKGLVAHLIYMEKQETALETKTPIDDDCMEADYTDKTPEVKLSDLDNQNF